MRSPIGENKIKAENHRLVILTFNFIFTNRWS